MSKKKRLINYYKINLQGHIQLGKQGARLSELGYTTRPTWIVLWLKQGNQTAQELVAQETTTWLHLIFNLQQPSTTTTTRTLS